MSLLKDLFNSSIGRKVMMSLSGIGFVGFLIGHVTGNLLLFKDDDGLAFNEYAHFMKTTPIIYVAEVLIFILIFVHVIDGIILTVKNKKARPIQYAGKKKASTATATSRYASVLGIILLIFFIIHMLDFFIPAKLLGQTTKVAGTDIDNLYVEVVKKFSYLPYVILYVICMLALAFHLAHGFQSAFQSLGFRHEKFTPMIKMIGYFVAVVIPTVFALMPVYIYIKG